MKITIEFTTGKKIELTSTELKELFGIDVNLKLVTEKPYNPLIPSYPTYPYYPVWTSGGIEF